ncbi:hemerythrin domain-containing protein [Pontibacter locisalis]|uniref:Hemerythrin domain-containing protein n=1 Tax=Pontibacter locisalis TaxID=1719035 RepID=A0ABW5IN01_9BACT
MKTILLLMLLVSFAAQAQKDSIQVKDNTAAHRAVQGQQFQIPSALKAEHEELHNTLQKYTELPGKTGAAAKEAAKILHPHFMKEEEYALPLLGLLPELAEGRVTADMKPAIAISEKLKQEHQQMLAEHQQIVKSLQTLKSAATEEKHPQVVRFVEMLQEHAKTEEQVLYPTAILIGEYLKLKL